MTIYENLDLQSTLVPGFRRCDDIHRDALPAYNSHNSPNHSARYHDYHTPPETRRLDSAGLKISHHEAPAYVDLGLRTPSVSPTSQVLPESFHNQQPARAQLPYSQLDRASTAQPMAMSHSHHQYQEAQLLNTQQQGYRYQPAANGTLPLYNHFGHAPTQSQAGTHYPTHQSYGPAYNYPMNLTSPHSNLSNGPVQASTQGHNGLPSLSTIGNHVTQSYGQIVPPNPMQMSMFIPGTTDPTGQLQPPGHKARVTGTLWEDEGTICVQVEVKGICIARRHDNNMINGTKLLNVVGMTRGRRDGILKSEKNRYVVKIGPMHLKGVWIPLQRALEFANKEKITDSLYPLFSNDIWKYHPVDKPLKKGIDVKTETLSSSEDATTPLRRRASEMNQLTATPPMLKTSGFAQKHTDGATPSEHAASGLHSGLTLSRPGFERAHTFPTPPTSASGTMPTGVAHGSTYDWSGAAINQHEAATENNNINGSALHHAQSTPATPATTPPGAMLPSLTAQSGPHSLFGAPANCPADSVPQAGILRSASNPNNLYVKTEMGPPVHRPSIARSEHDHTMEPYTPSSALDNKTQIQSDDKHERTTTLGFTHSDNVPYSSQRSTLGAYGQTNGLRSYSGMTASAPDHGHSTESGFQATRPAVSQWLPESYDNPNRAAATSSTYFGSGYVNRSVLNDGPKRASQSSPSAMYGIPNDAVTIGTKRGRDDDDDEHDEMLKRRRHLEPLHIYDGRDVNGSRHMLPTTTRAH